MNRLHNLDYLRGLAAFGIMMYHYLMFTFGIFPSETFIGRVGVYGVSIFYVLSGLTLYYVYYNKMLPSKPEILSFFKKRFFRIFPLLWLVTVISIILSKKLPDMTQLILNLTGLFGLIQWDKYFSAGVWSIGNELVFYIFFPFFIFFTKQSKIMMIILSLFIFSFYLYFAFILLDRNIDLQLQWRNYVNPLNQVFLFLGGFLIGLVFQNITIKNSVSLLVLILGLCIFIFYPVYGNTIHLVTGFTRIIFTVSCFLICLSFYKLSFKLPTIAHQPLALLGEASYSVYLLHPLVYSIINIFSKYFFHFPKSIILILSVISTLVISYFVYEYFEKYFMKMGSKKKNNLGLLT